MLSIFIKIRHRNIFSKFKFSYKGVLFDSFLFTFSHIDLGYKTKNKISEALQVLIEFSNPFYSIVNFLKKIKSYSNFKTKNIKSEITKTKTYIV